MTSDKAISIRYIEERKKALKLKEENLNMKNALQVNFDFTDADFHSALAKLSEAAWKYDKNLPGSGSLAAFDGESMPPHQFKEQLRAVLGIKLNAPELGALMSYFDTNGDGVISCAEFLVTFIKTGFKEKFRRRQQYRQYQQEKEIQKKAAAELKLYNLEHKNSLKVEYEFAEEDFTSAMGKLTHAAMLYDRSMPGCIQLTAFECDSMPPHVFKEQLKLVFGIKLTPPELGALMAYFDKFGEGSVNCTNFQIQFLRTGFEERNRVRKEYRELLKTREERVQKVEMKKVEKETLRQLKEVDYEFTETTFDSSLQKLVAMCHSFDGRTLGPAGWKAFDSASLNPSQFKEMMKRTFNVHLNPQELGAMVTYFDTEMTGSVSCVHFLNCFVQMRVRIESFKGKQDEERNMFLYRCQLKEMYRARIQKQMTGDSSEAKKRPWRSAISTAGSLQAVRASKEKKKSYPKTPSEKLKRRLYIAKVSGKMDLSCKMNWSDENITIDSGAGLEEDGNNVDTGMHDRTDAEIRTAVKRNMKKLGILHTNWVERPNATPTTAPSTANSLGPMNPPLTAPASLINNESASRRVSVVNNLDDIFDGGIAGHLHSGALNSNAFDIRLSKIPKEVFKTSFLKELWLCNNAIPVIPSEIASLRCLKVLSISNCRLQRLPPEICLVKPLETLYANGNLLTCLPELFWKLSLLKTLDIGKNEFTEFPEVLCRNHSLVSLSIAHNNLTSLPSSFKQLTALRFFNAAGTKIAEFPSVLHHLRGLFCIGLVDSKTTNTCTVYQKDGHVVEKNRATASTGKKSKKKKLSPDQITMHVAPVPTIPISMDEEKELTSFLQHRAAARKSRTVSNTPSVGKQSELTVAI